MSTLLLRRRELTVNVTRIFVSGMTRSGRGAIIKSPLTNWEQNASINHMEFVPVFKSNCKEEMLLGEDFGSSVLIKAQNDIKLRSFDGANFFKFNYSIPSETRYFSSELNT